MRLEDLKPFMTHTNCFTRHTVARALSKRDGALKFQQCIDRASALLRAARAEGAVRYIEGRDRSCYYDFVKSESPKGGDSILGEKK